MNKVGEFFTRKLGPLPTWGWGVIGIAGIVFYLRYRATHTATSASAPNTASVPFGTSAAGTGTTAAGYAPTLSDQIGALTGDISALQGLNTALGLGPTGTQPTASGGPIYGPTTGGRYVPTTSTQDVMNAVNAGLPVYYQPTPGGPFVQIPASELFPGSGYTSTFLFEPSAVGNNVPTAPGSSITATPNNSSGGILSGGNPAPIQPAPSWLPNTRLPQGVVSGPRG